jgi:serine phosphatase RsbU (regulator of sigma subunit)
MAMTPLERLASVTMIATHEIVVNLEKAKSALESLIKNMQDLTCLATVEGRVIWGNEMAANWLGANIDLLHLNNLRQLFKPEHWETFCEHIKAFTEKGDAGATIELHLPIIYEGAAREILWSIRIFSAVSIRRGTVLLVVGRDITDVLKERAAKAKLESEIETVQVIQSAFFPTDHIKNEKIEVCSFYHPADQCSGDWWGHFQLADNLNLVSIADVTGHGAPSALLTAMTQAVCMHFVNTITDRPSPALLMKQLNKVICDTFKGKLFMTFFAMLFDTERKTLIAANAGHNFPVYISGSLRQKITENPHELENILAASKPKTLSLRGNPIGFDPRSEYTEKEFHIEALDRFVMFTDGIIECKNREGQMWGAPTMRKTINRNLLKNAISFRDAVVHDAFEFYGKQPLNDDVTLVTIDILS